MKNLVNFLFLLFLSIEVQAQNSLTATYNSGDIPTSFDTYDDSCNGPSATLSVTLPPGDIYEVTAVDVEYEMTAMGSGFTSHQRSLIKCQNTNLEESIEAIGENKQPGTYIYSRSIPIANDKYAGNTELIFEMKARRTFEGSPGCNTSINKVDATTWQIVVHYKDELSIPKVGVNKTTPSQSLDVKGKLKIGDDITAPEAGTIRWNNVIKDYEGYNGVEWLSFTKNEGGSWGNKDITENTSKIAFDGQENDFYGKAVAISGDYAIVGANQAKIGTNNYQGKAYLYKNENGNWISQVSPVPSDGALNDKYGSAVCISGDYAIIGAPSKFVNSNLYQGKAYILKNTNSTWVEQAGIVASDASQNDYFGSSVSISGDYAVVGATWKDIGINDRQGKVYIYKRMGSSWEEQACLIQTDGGEDDFFGSSVSISGDYVIVGAASKDVGSNSNQGKVYIFKRTGSSWEEQTSIIISGGMANNHFGISVSISGNYAAVSGFNIPVYIFKRSGVTWSEQASIVASDGSSNDYFGSSVSISGSYLIIGASKKEIQNRQAQGKAYIYKRTGTSWSEQTGIIASDGKKQDFFGSSVSISGNNIIVGAYNVDVEGLNSQGKTYFYSKNIEN